MQHTTNYNLTIFEQNDVPSWLSDWNGNMTDIDTAIAAAKVAADGAQSTASGAQNASEQNASAIESLSTTVNQQGGTLTNLAGAVNTINSLIGNGTPTTTDQTIIGAINEINAAYKVAANIVFTPGASGMQSTNVEDAIKEAYNHGGAGTVTAANVTYDNTTSGLNATDVQDAIDEVYAAIPQQQSVNVRWNSVTDRFEVLKNGSWVQSIRAFVNSIAVLVNGVFGVPMSDAPLGIYADKAATPFTVTQNGLSATYSASNKSYAYVTDDKIDFTNYSSVKVTVHGQEAALNVSQVSGSYYLQVSLHTASGATSLNTFKIALLDATSNISYMLEPSNVETSDTTAFADNPTTVNITEITVE